MDTLLTKSQKKFIRKNSREYTFEEIAYKINVRPTDVYQYLQRVSPTDKMQKLIKENKSIKNTTKSPYYFFHFLKPYYIPILILLILVIICYSNSLNNEFISDDVRSIVEMHDPGNFSLHVLSNPLGFLVPLIYFVVFKIGGITPIFFRLPNIIFHLGSSILIYLLLTKMYNNRRIGFISSSIFAVHPLLTESVAWISGIPYSSYTFIFLLSFYLYVSAENKKKVYLLSLFFFFLCLETNLKAAFFMPVFFLYELAKSRLRKNWKKTAPFLLISLVWIFFIAFQIKPRIENLTTNFYAPVETENLIYKIPYALSSYIFLFFWPDKLTFYHLGYPETLVKNLPYILTFLCYLFFMVLSFFKNRLAFFWLLFFVVPLTPSLSPLSLTWNVAERYTYPGLISLTTIIAIVFDFLVKKKNIRYVIYPLFILIIAGLSVRTIYRNLDWKTERSFYEATLVTSPLDAKSHYNVAAIYSENNEYDKAIKEYIKTLEIYPEYVDAFSGLADVYLAQDNLQLAGEAYEDALYINPKYYRAYQGLANLYYHLGNNKLALENMEKALKLNPDDEIFLENLGTIYLDMGEKEKARELFLKSLQINPGYEPALADLQKL